MNGIKVCVIGMGPAGLMAGTQLLKRGFEVHFFDQKVAAGRKFLVAGHGGFNLTHSEPVEAFIQRYNHSFIQEAVKTFTNDDFRAWLSKEIKIETYIGSSGKIFPIKGIKPIQVLHNWINYLHYLGAHFHYQHKCIDFSDKEVLFSTPSGEINIAYDRLVFAFGGASWKTTGSLGDWIELFDSKQISTVPFQSSNAGFEIHNWEMVEGLAGMQFKNCAVHLGHLSTYGEITLTTYGLEGTPIYHLNEAFREHHFQELTLDLKPTKTEAEITQILKLAKNSTAGLKTLKLAKAAIEYLKISTPKTTFTSPSLLAQVIKKVPLTIASLRPIDEVISTIGGISMDTIQADFQLINNPNLYFCGEMLDWDAPTGGYLIQGCVSSGFIVGTKLN